MNSLAPPPHKEDDTFENRVKRHRFWGPFFWGLGILGVIVAIVVGVSRFMPAGEPVAADDAPTITTPDSEPALVPGWSPERTTYTGEHPAPGPVLNSITDNPDVGSELNFVRLRIADDPHLDGTYGDVVQAEPGQRVQVSVLVSNDASPGLGDSGMIVGLEALVEAENGPNGALLKVLVRGDNADQVADSALVESPTPIHLTYLDGSATFKNSSGTHAVPDSIGHISWTQLGSDDLNGEMRVGLNPATGVNHDLGYLTFTVLVESA